MSKQHLVCHPQCMDGDSTNCKMGMEPPTHAQCPEDRVPTLWIRELAAGCKRPEMSPDNAPIATVATVGSPPTLESGAMGDVAALRRLPPPNRGPQAEQQHRGRKRQLSPPPPPPWPHPGLPAPPAVPPPVRRGQVPAFWPARAQPTTVVGGGGGGGGYATTAAAPNNGAAPWQHPQDGVVLVRGQPVPDPINSPMSRADREALERIRAAGRLEEYLEWEQERRATRARHAF